MRRSLATRTALLATGVGVVLIAVLLVVVSVMIRDAVFTDRRQVILNDAAQHAAAVQAAFEATAVSTDEEFVELGNVQIETVRRASAGAGGIGVLLRSAGDDPADAAFDRLSTDDALADLITSELSNAMKGAEEGKHYWQSVSVPGRTGQVPGIIVGQRVTLPPAGAFDLYVVYSLESEAQVVDRTTRVVVFAGAGFLLIVILAVWALTWRVLIPIRRTSLAAQRLAAGRLNERLVVQGDDEITALSRSFNHMAASLESQIEAWENLSKVEKLFVSDVSHELRTPLASIRLASEQIWAARDEIDDPFAARSLEILMREVDRFEEMLTDLLEISRIDSGRVHLRAEEADLLAVLRGVLDLVAVHVEAKGAQINLELPDEPVVAELDTTRVARILRNLVVNALEHAEGSRIDIRVAGNDDAVAVRVRDHGVGMSPDVVKKVFDRFFRADPSRRRTLGGTGLGLSISLEDAVLHGGTVTAWGWPSDGASFLLVLPRRLGPGATPGGYDRPGPLDVVPEDAPAVSRATTRRDAEAASSRPMGPTPASRRADLARPDGGEGQARDGDTGTGRVTVVGPGDAPSARTPEDSGPRSRAEGRR